MAAWSTLETTTTADRRPQTAGPWNGPVLVVEDLGQQRLPARRLVAILRDAGVPAELVHVGPVGETTSTCDRDAKPLLDLARRTRPRLIVFSILFADRVPETLGIIAALRKAGIDSHLALAGPLPSFAAEELLAACSELDSVLCGEPEGMIVELATALLSNSRWQHVPGLAIRNPNGGVVTQLRAIRGALDELPPPVQDCPLPIYQHVGFATVEASRGCYHRCSFCLPAAFHRAAGIPYRLRGIESLVDEMETLYHRGARLFLFDDEQFLPPPRNRESRVKAFGDELRRRGMTIAFTLKCRADDVEPALFGYLKEMGLVRVYVGVESGCQATLELFTKGTSAQRNLEALTTLDKLGIVADLRSLLFHPWSSLELIDEDLAFWRRALPHLPGLLSFREIEIFPGTPLADRCRAEEKTTGVPWSLTYTLVNPRAELLRRLGRLVFSTSPTYQDAERQVAQAWYAILLQRRFREGQRSSMPVHKLKESTGRLNADTLSTWSEMLGFVSSEDIFDADLVNERAGRWVECMGLACDRLIALLPRM